jgi:hypothetical protein
MLSADGSGMEIVDANADEDAKTIVPTVIDTAAAMVLIPGLMVINRTERRD